MGIVGSTVKTGLGLSILTAMAGMILGKEGDSIMGLFGKLGNKDISDALGVEKDGTLDSLLGNGNAIAGGVSLGSAFLPSWMGALRRFGIVLPLLYMGFNLFKSALKGNFNDAAKQAYAYAKDYAPEAGRSQPGTSKLTPEQYQELLRKPISAERSVVAEELMRSASMEAERVDEASARATAAILASVNGEGVPAVFEPGARVTVVDQVASLEENAANPGAIKLSLRKASAVVGAREGIKKMDRFPTVAQDKKGGFEHTKGPDGPEPDDPRLDFEDT